jgi:hypothetical protein
VNVSLIDMAWPALSVRKKGGGGGGERAPWLEERRRRWKGRWGFSDSLFISRPHAFKPTSHLYKTNQAFVTSPHVSL